MAPPAAGDYARIIGGAARLVAGVGLVLVVASCRGVPAEPLSPIDDARALRIEESPTPFDRVTIGPVSALVPERWQPAAADRDGSFREGLVAAPDPERWAGFSPRTEGMAAVWLDVADVGLASDLYYLAARPMASRLATEEDCRTTKHHVLVDHRPSGLSDGGPSRGDFVATGRGVCIGEEGATRWAYFIAAPGYGPVRSLGIPSSGLYLVLAVVPDSPKAPRRLDRLMRSTTFGGVGIDDLLEAAQGDAVPA